jgi:endonuclease/exonuclease/phosphatase (EEP) superfamily protein YafD
LSRYDAPPKTDEAEDAEDLNEKRKPLRHRQRGQALFWFAVALAILGAGRLGHLYPHFDVFSQFSFQAGAMALAFALALLFGRYKVIWGKALTILFLAGYSIWPHMVSAKLQQGPYPLAPDEKLLRIVHFNTYKNNVDYNAIAQEVIRLDGDVVSLVEMSATKIKALLPLLKQVYPNQYDCNLGRDCDIAIVSKHPIKQASGREHWAGAPYALAQLGGAFDGVSFMSLHTIRFPHSRAQFKQINGTVKLLETIPGGKIVMGDFNATPFSRVTALFAQGTAMSRLTELPTWPAQLQLPQLAIDHAFASSDFRVVGNQQIGNAVGSDHYPIVLTLAYKKKP